MFSNIAILISILIFGLSPLLIPLTITGFHAIAIWHRNHKPFPTIIRRQSPASSPAD